MSIHAELNRQQELAQWIDGKLSRPYELSARNLQLAHPCFDLPIEHHAAICLLCKANLYGSMHSLLRVEFEALARGLWLCHVASGEDILKYENENVEIGFGMILQLIDKEFDLHTSVLSDIKGRLWKMFCSFTHTGYQASVRRVGRTHTGAVNYQDQEVVSALRHAGLFVILSAAELASMTDDQDLIKSTLAMAKRYGE